MFCRNCGKQLLDNAVACIGCGMSPHHGHANCPSCGVPTQDKQILCTGCGSHLNSQGGGNANEWSRGSYIGFLIVSFLIPIVGLLYGGINVKNAAGGSQRENQAWHFVIAGFIGLALSIIIASG